MGPDGGWRAGAVRLRQRALWAAGVRRGHRGRCCRLVPVALTGTFRSVGRVDLGPDRAGRVRLRQEAPEARRPLRLGHEVQPATQQLLALEVDVDVEPP